MHLQAPLLLYGSWMNQGATGLKRNHTCSDKSELPGQRPR